LHKGGNDSPSIELTSLGDAFLFPPAFPGRTNGDVFMKESYWGLGDTCPLSTQDFLETLAKIENYVNHLSEHWWTHGFPGNEGFSCLNFSRVSSGFSANVNDWKA
jgi:hypothetical protein